jgi:membrane associated rhomboid family serine protease
MDPVDSQQAEEAIVYHSARNTDIENCSLVLSAKNIGHRLRQDHNGTITILVPASRAEEARYQLDCFFRENENWPLQEPLRGSPAITAAPPTLLLIVALAVFHRVTGPWRYDSIWFSQGAGDASAILYHGEWYRLLTALTLHADLPHLLGNVLIGGLLMHFFLQIHGSGLGFLAILLASGAGNYLNVIVHGGTHRFVGFSTAVFAIIGMLSVYQLVEQRRPPSIRTLLPLMGGVALLAMLGSSGERTDLGAHLFGLLAGIASGFILGLEPIRKLKYSSFLQTCLFFVSVSILLIAWNMALSPQT